MRDQICAVFIRNCHSYTLDSMERLQGKQLTNFASQHVPFADDTTATDLTTCAEWTLLDKLRLNFFFFFSLIELTVKARCMKNRGATKL